MFISIVAKNISLNSWVETSRATREKLRIESVKSSYESNLNELEPKFRLI